MALQHSGQLKCPWRNTWRRNPTVPEITKDVFTLFSTQLLDIYASISKFDMDPQHSV